jgi:hypothetical protein
MNEQNRWLLMLKIIPFMPAFLCCVFPPLHVCNKNRHKNYAFFHRIVIGKDRNTFIRI